MTTILPLGTTAMILIVVLKMELVCHDVRNTLKSNQGLSQGPLEKALFWHAVHELDKFKL